jgi:hypothetical protein
MEERGLISGYDGSKPRQVLVSKAEWQELKMGANNSTSNNNTGASDDVTSIGTGFEVKESDDVKISASSMPEHSYTVNVYSGSNQKVTKENPYTTNNNDSTNIARNEVLRLQNQNRSRYNVDL